MSQVFVVDDSDPGIVYHGNWTKLAAVTTLAISGGTTNEYNSTVHGSHTAGDTLTYSFTGTSLGVWGTLDRTAMLGSPNATFTMDNLPPFTFNQTGHVKSDLPNNSMSHLLLYQSPRLADGEHTLTVTVAPSATQAMFYVDFFMIEKEGPGNVIVDDFDMRLSFEGD
ncbi:hypothetical protein M408DRAFT_25032 [Serendipita vermifera MAFF 305830]|uniref:Uncharacterized protein n=1 Tax=Serendipita vermifera MAFF 305830 TaxID=933852 RepID=A0A0C3B5K0_SERVB|nr:hypothetical protein M408DRAFT_25032 [Serendipita vermifera MAFF 305830]